MCSFSPHLQGLLFSDCGGGTSLSSHCTSTNQKPTESVGWGGFTQQHVMPRLPITCPSPTQPPSREALSYQHHSPKPITATPKPVSAKVFRGPLCPSSFPLVSLLPLCLVPTILPSFHTACVSSFSSNERQGSARQTPGVWQSYLLCLHISSSIARALSLSLLSSHTLSVSLAHSP